MKINKFFNNIDLKYRLITIHLTHKCNYDCWYCYDIKNKTKYNYHVDLDIVINYVSEIHKKFINEKIDIQLIGGEPTLYPKLYELLEIFFNLNYINQINIITNGSLKINFFEKFLPFKNKLYFTFSYHNIYFENFISLLYKLKDLGFSFNVSFMLQNNSKLEEFEEMKKHFNTSLISIRNMEYNEIMDNEIKKFNIENKKYFLVDKKIFFLQDIVKKVKNSFYNTKCDIKSKLYILDINGKLHQNCNFKIIENINDIDNISNVCDSEYCCFVFHNKCIK